MAWLFIAGILVLVLLILKLIANKNPNPKDNFTADVIRLARSKNGYS